MPLNYTRYSGILEEQGSVTSSMALSLPLEGILHCNMFLLQQVLCVSVAEDHIIKCWGLKHQNHFSPRNVVYLKIVSKLQEYLTLNETFGWDILSSGLNPGSLDEN